MTIEQLLMSCEFDAQYEKSRCTLIRTKLQKIENIGLVGNNDSYKAFSYTKKVTLCFNFSSQWPQAGAVGQ